MMEHDQDINRALVIYLVGESGFYSGHRDKARVIAEFGESRGNELLRQIDEIESEVEYYTPDWKNVTYEQAIKIQSSRYAEKYPFLNKESLAAIEQTYAFDWK